MLFFGFFFAKRFVVLVHHRYICLLIVTPLELPKSLPILNSSKFSPKRVPAVKALIGHGIVLRIVLSIFLESQFLAGGIAPSLDRLGAPHKTIGVSLYP